MRSAGDRSSRLVWDLPVRITHWLLALCVPLAWLTHELGTEYFRWHVYNGYTVAILVVFRLAWGIVGTRHARFSSFLRGPVAVVRYLRSSRGELHQASAGHNPAGGWMVVVLLALCGLQASTGLFANDQIFNTGPFYGWVTASTSERLSSLHRRSYDWLLIAVAIHVLAVIVYLVAGKGNLVAPMLTGRKPAREVADEQAIRSSRLPLAGTIALIAAGALALAVRLAPEATLSVSF